MIEAGNYKAFKKIIVVHCSRELQIERIMKRENVSRREAIQELLRSSRHEKSENMQITVINTSGPFTQTRKQVVQVYEKLRKIPYAKK